VEVVLPDGTVARGLFDVTTKADQIKGFKTEVLADTPSVVLQERLRLGTHLTIGGETYTVRDLETDADGALTRHFLTEGMDG